MEIRDFPDSSDCAVDSGWRPEDCEPSMNPSASSGYCFLDAAAAAILDFSMIKVLDRTNSSRERKKIHYSSKIIALAMTFPFFRDRKMFRGREFICNS